MTGPPTVYCSCGHPLTHPGGAGEAGVVCPGCGTLVSVPPPQEAEVFLSRPVRPPAWARTTRMNCPLCQEEIDTRDEQCPHCGELLGTARLAPPGAPPASDYQRFVPARTRQKVHEYGNDGQTALVLGIVGLFFCAPILGPIAVLKGIEGVKQEGQQGLAITGMVLGCVGFLAWLVGIALFLLAGNIQPV